MSSNSNNSIENTNTIAQESKKPKKVRAPSKQKRQPKPADVDHSRPIDWENACRAWMTLAPIKHFYSNEATPALVQAPASTSSSKESGKKKRVFTTAAGERLRKPSSAYLLWSADERKRLSPEESAKSTETLKLLGHRWKSINPELKKHYEARAAEEQKKYEEKKKLDGGSWSFAPASSRSSSSKKKKSRKPSSGTSSGDESSVSVA